MYHRLDPPGPPKNLHHTDADKTEVWLAWQWPDRTGGSEITGFIVEYQEESQTDWVTFKTVSNNHTHITSLEEGKTYRFRVKAQNAIGLSRPDTSVPITCQEKTCKKWCSLFIDIIEGFLPAFIDLQRLEDTGFDCVFFFSTTNN